MPILTREQFLDRIKMKIGDGTSDEDLAFVQDMTETFDSLNSSEDWKKKYEDNDREWREKYRDTFLTGRKIPDEDEDENPKNSPVSYEDLFTVMKGK